MSNLSEWIDPVIWALAAIAAIACLVAARPGRTATSAVGRLFLVLAAGALIAALALPQLLPARSASVHPDGSTDDPRVLSALFVALAALASLAPSVRALKLSPTRAFGLAIPGVLLAGVLGAVATFAGLHAPMGLTALVLGAFGLGSALTLALRGARTPGATTGVAQGFGACLLVLGGTLSLHGARATNLGLAEGASADTLGQHVTFTHARAPHADQHVLDFRLGTGRDTTTLHAELIGARGKGLRSIAAGQALTGPILVPLALDERRPHAHGISWLAKNEPLVAGGATLRFDGFRITHTDSIRMYADIEVTTPAGVEKVSPGLIATAKGEIPFAATAKGFGQVAVVGIDADHGRVGLMLPQIANAEVQQAVAIDLRLRPMLPVAWLGFALALLGFLLALRAAPADPARR